MDQITQTPVLEQHAENVEAKKGRLSPINQRRWQNFKRHRRGYWSLWIFTILFVLSLFAEMIANNKPFLVSYDGKWHYPIFQFYPETAFGGDFETEANYRDPEVQRLIKEKNGTMLWPLIPFHYSTINYDVPTPAPSKPTWMYTEAECKAAAEKKGVTGCSGLDQNWLGTDTAARDVTARMIYGFRISVIFGLTLTILSSIIGIAAGAVQGYFGGWVDLTFQRFIEIWTSIPTLYVLLIVAAVLPQGFFVLLGILLLFSWTSLVGVVRAEFLRTRNFEYVQAARALGVSNSVLMYRHILPNAMVATLTFMPFILSGSVMTLTALDYLGYGLPPGSPSLGELLNQGRNNLQAPWLGITGFFTVAILLTLLIFIGEAIRDAFDPRKTFS
ncbi:MAG TPA: ABC transporter permease [Xanthobacteraceae bacterium]|nr:ABC transporter permease [Xanthobacteraceae bacterium]